MPEPPAIYRQENGISLIEIRLTSVRQLFNSFDPSPFHEKDLDKDAEEYIVEAMQEFPHESAVKIRFYLPESERAGAGTVDLARALHNYFGYRLWIMRSHLRDLMRRGRDALVIGVVFLAATLVVRELVLAFAPDTLTKLIAEGFQIAGWVALWQPIQIFFYDWRPMRRMVRIYGRLSTIDVEIKFSAPS